jgi:hypothetical protein
VDITPEWEAFECFQCRMDVLLAATNNDAIFFF